MGRLPETTAAPSANSKQRAPPTHPPLGVISFGWLWRNRFYWVSGPGLLANFMMPGGDPLVTPVVVFVPLLAFYLGSRLLLKLSGR